MPSGSLVRGPWIRRRASMVVAAAVFGLSLAVALPAIAYNQLKPPGDPNNVGDCHNSGGGPCEHWAKTASNLSITVDVHLTLPLADEEVDLRQIGLNAMNAYNVIPARNPLLQQTTSSTLEEVWVSASNFGSPTTYASTNNDYNASGLITYSTMSFNTQIIWNQNYNYFCGTIDGTFACRADADKVVRHEFGHLEGLAHIGTAIGVMIQGDPVTNYHSLRPDDKDGIIHIYGAYP